MSPSSDWCEMHRSVQRVWARYAATSTFLLGLSLLFPRPSLSHPRMHEVQMTVPGTNYSRWMCSFPPGPPLTLALRQDELPVRSLYGLLSVQSSAKGAVAK
ncbi:hypothetical protein F5Y18DRAFT_427108 [Xylariaceae sp. FL1019]|nr:hypothetical protein F5Y18DRAFT_427108 [Xylariaceae sp. FL1019]